MKLNCYHLSEIQNNCLGTYTKGRKLHQHLQYNSLIHKIILIIIHLLAVPTLHDFMHPTISPSPSANISKRNINVSVKKFQVCLGKIIGAIIQILSYLNAQRRSCWCITFNNISFFVNKELGEVPFDFISKESSLA